MQVFKEPKPVGRPRAIDPRAVRIEVRFSQQELALIDAYQPQGTPQSRSAAVRALVLLALKTLEKQ